MDRLADRICVIDHGRVISEGTSTELKARLGGTAVEVVLPDEDTGPYWVANALSGVGDAAPVLDGLTVTGGTTSGLATTSEVVRRLETTGMDVSSLQLRQPSLDDVFLALTGQAPGGDDAADPETEPAPAAKGLDERRPEPARVPDRLGDR